MPLADLEYYLDRARTELDLAQQVACPEAATMHRTLARRFLERVHEEHERLWLLIK